MRCNASVVYNCAVSLKVSPQHSHRSLFLVKVALKIFSISWVSYKIRFHQQFNQLLIKEIMTLLYLLTPLRQPPLSTAVTAGTDTVQKLACKYWTFGAFVKLFGFACSVLFA